MNIVCGDPSKEPASYTRFVLPFAYKSYKPQRDLNHDAKDLHYEVIAPEPDRVWRERYLTHEIADVLFRRVKWLRLMGDRSTIEVSIRFKDEYELLVTIAPPMLILFEWPRDPKGLNDEDPSGSILQTGFLVVELFFSPHNDRPPVFEALLELNELFRYWQKPYEGHELRKENGKDKGYKPLLSNLPFKIGSSETIGQKNDAIDLYLERWASLLELPLRIDNDWWRLFPSDWPEKARHYVREGPVSALLNKCLDPLGWVVYADNRTFLWTCAIVEGGTGTLRRQFAPLRTNASAFGHWIKLLNVDPPGNDCFATHQSREFERTWAEERTYKRWEEWGTIYGFNYHCGAMIGPAIKGLPIWKHFRQMYFDQTLLLLYIRVSLFRFSMRLNEISARAIDARDGKKKWRRDFEQLRWYFNLFTNLYQFPLLSNQQQAIEMYTIARKHMDVDELFNEIKKEIFGSHEYLSMIEGKEQAHRIQALTLLATLGLALSLAVGFWGMNIISDDLKKLVAEKSGIRDVLLTLLEAITIDKIDPQWPLLMVSLLIFIVMGVFVYLLIRRYCGR